MDIFEGLKWKIQFVLMKIPLLRKLLKMYIRRTSPVCIISFKKAGRTWLNVLIGKAIQLHCNLNEEDYLKLPRTRDRCIGFPGISFIHDDAAHWKKPEELTQSKARYKYKKIIFLARDPRDVVVSIYFEKHKRLPAYIDGEKLEYPLSAEIIQHYKGSLSNYIYESMGSFDTILRFYNIWAENSNNIDDYLLVRYEDFHITPHKELRKVLNFVGLKDVSNEIINEAIEFASFKNMRSMEQKDKLKSVKLRPVNKEDTESYKTRAGKAGGYAKYLKEDEIEYLNIKMKENLSDFYHYKS